MTRAPCPGPRAARIPFLVALGFSIGTPACRRDTSRVGPDPVADARAIDAVAAPKGPECLRLSTCGGWGGCVLAVTQPVPFSMYDGGPQVTTGKWYRFPWSDRPSEIGMLDRVCPRDAGACFESLVHQVPCLMVFNATEPGYRCELVDRACTRLPDPAPHP